MEIRWGTSTSEFTHESIFSNGLMSGFCVQIHISKESGVSIYSRNQENNTSKYPDIISRLDACKTEHVESCILDCEAVAWDNEKKSILPFQILSTRKRKVI